VHENLVREVEFNIMDGTYNIKTVVKFGTTPCDCC